MIVNGVECEWARELDIATLLSQLDISTRGIAVAINGEVIPRSLWLTTVIQSADSVEVVTAAAGG